MNFDWVEDYFKREWNCWGPETYLEYGLSSSEAFYADALLEVNVISLHSILEHVFGGTQDSFTINNTNFRFKNGLVHISNRELEKDNKYQLPLEEFLRNVMYLNKFRGKIS